VLLLAMLLSTSACYLGHVAAGQLDLLRSSTPIEGVIGDPETPDATREGLELVLEARRFAASLGLEVDGQYTHYAEWPGDRLVTTVVATRPGEVSPADFWFPIVGSVPYKGYFASERANAEADALRVDGYDVCVSPVRAYSTLGWFSDPITGPMLRQDPGRVVETVIHELVHANIYAASQADFNESIATFIGEEARVAFFAQSEGSEGEARERQRIRTQRAYRDLLEATRQEIATLYAAEASAADRLASRRSVEETTRARIAALGGFLDPEAAARGARLNDACLALSGTYGVHIAGYERLMEERDLDLPALIRWARRAADSEDPLESLEAHP
jgi:predicted aminopeptidase